VTQGPGPDAGARLEANSRITVAVEEPVDIDVDRAIRVQSLLRTPSDARACLVLAHGAGAGMRHPFMAAMSTLLAERRIATLRYQFPYVERGSRRTDPPAICHATVRAAMRTAARSASGLPLFAGGKSFGGRMTSQAQAAAPLEGVRGLVFLGFPLHPTGKPADARAAHLSDVQIPMLFLQGTRDALAEPRLLEPVIGRLGRLATVRWFEDADHAFHVPARTRRNDDAVRRELVEAMTAWMVGLIGGQ
jgi:predicted alpha/beta-hydrolase family hydrolase